MARSYLPDYTGMIGDSLETNPVSAMMEAGYRHCGLHCSYLMIQVPDQKLSQAVDTARLLSMKGFHVAHPYQKKVAELLDELSPAAKITEYVTSVRNQDGILIGENTVGKGLSTSLMEAGILVPEKRVVILGDGYAAKAAAAECAISGASFVTIISRSREKGQQLADIISEKCHAATRWIPWSEEAKIPAESDIVINCTKAGEQEISVDFCSILPSMTVCDMAWKNPDTAFLRNAGERGAVTVSGRNVFLNRFSLDFMLWTDEFGSKMALSKALSEALEEDGHEEAEEVSEEDRERVEQLIKMAVEYDRKDARRIQHFLKVYTYAKLIGKGEKLPNAEMDILQAAAVLHDIGIHKAEEKYGSSAGRYQEIEGPDVAEPILRACGYTEEEIDRILYLIANHHTYGSIEGDDYQILVEADFLVNLYEDHASEQTVHTARERIFRTETGRWLLDMMY